MSRIERVRIINLNYNNNTMHLDDELFHFNGESTFLSLRNGGGKSVLVQILLAPFIKKNSYRDLQDRKFSSFFTTSTPTYILVEWALDGGTNRVLTGMMVRKRITQSDEDAKDELEMVQFIHEYNGANSYDIESIPFIEDNGTKKKVKSFVHSRQLFEKMKKEHVNRFNYFDMNNATHKKNYFEKLKEFKINHKEWEDIIRKINLQESGLSTLFKEAKNEKGLIEKWFLTSIETKLNREEDKIKNFKKIVLSYAKQFRENKSKIEKRSTMNVFFEDELTIREKAKTLKENMSSIEQFKNQIALFIQYLEETEQKLSSKKERITEQIELINQEMDELKYEKLSIEIHKNNDIKEKIEKEWHALMNDLKEQTQSQEDMLQRTHILECAKIYEEYTEFSKEVQDLENKLDIMRKKGKDFTPEINNLGFTLNRYYQEKKEQNQRLINENQENLSNVESKGKAIGVQLNEFRQQQTHFSEHKGQLRSQIDSFDAQEKNFNRQHNDLFSRNLLGLYEEGLLLAKEEEYKKRLTTIQKNIEENNQAFHKNKEMKNQKEHEHSEVKDKKAVAEGDLKNLRNTLNDYSEKVKKMKEILKYISFSEEQLFEKENVLAAFDSKITQLSDILEKEKRNKQTEEQALTRLKTGTISDLPQEIEDEFRKKDIYYTSGLKWLRSNHHPADVNKEMVRKNPFLPYALIMNTRDLQKLERNPIEKYTSFPIVIINREDLNNDEALEEKKLTRLGKVNFLISFNQQLIDEAALQQLIEEKEQHIQSIQFEIKRKEQGKNDFEAQRNWVFYKSVDQTDYDTALNQRESLEKELDTYNEQLIQLRNEINRFNQLMEEAERNRQNETRKENQIKSLQQDFLKLRSVYQEYLSNREKLEQLKSKEKELVSRIRIAEKTILDVDSEKSSLEASGRELTEKKKTFTEYTEEFRSYKDGEIVVKDIEDIQSRFESLTKVIKGDTETLEDNLSKATKRFGKKEEELTNKQSEYSLKDSQFKEKSYDSFEEKRAKNELQQINQQIESLKDDRHAKQLDVQKWESDIQYQLIKLKEKFDKDAPKNRSVLKEIDFTEKIEQLKLYQRREQMELDETIEQTSVVTRNIDALSEYEELEMIEEIPLMYSIGELTKARKELIRDYKAALEAKDDSKVQLDKELETILRKEMYYIDDFFKKPLEILRELTDVPDDLLENLTVTSKSYHNLMDKLDADIELIEKEKENVLQSLFDYVYEVHENLGEIDRGSNISLRGRSLKMLRIFIPDWEEYTGVYKGRLTSFLDRIVARAIEALESNESVEDRISHELTTKNLYDEIVGIGNVDIKLYKVEEYREYPISWSEVAKNSGGEGFLSAFVILTSLLSYMGRDDTDIFAEKENSKVLIMDNPFAQTNAEHLLKPLMEMAKKSNTQLICFSGLGGDSIYNRFDNIYVLNLLSSKLKRNMSYLKAEHLKGEDSGMSMISSNFQIVDEVEQESLF